MTDSITSTRNTQMQYLLYLTELKFLCSIIVGHQNVLLSWTPKCFIIMDTKMFYHGTRKCSIIMDTKMFYHGTSKCSITMRHKTVLSWDTKVSYYYRKPIIMGHQNVLSVCDIKMFHATLMVHYFVPLSSALCDTTPEYSLCTINTSSHLCTGDTSTSARREDACFSTAVVCRLCFIGVYM